MQIILGGGCFWCLESCFQLLPNVNSVTCGYAGGASQNPTYEEVCSGKTGHIEVVLIDYNEKKEILDSDILEKNVIENNSENSTFTSNFEKNLTKETSKTDFKSEQKTANSNLANSKNQNEKSNSLEILKVSTLEKILDIFWQIHNPTTLNRQGADIGSQYASVIFWQNQTQLEIINKSLEKLANSGKYQDQIVTKIEQKLDFKTTFWKAEEKHQNYFAKNPNQSYCQIVVLPKIEKTRKILESE